MPETIEETDLQEISAKACEYLEIPVVTIVVKGGASRGRGVLIVLSSFAGVAWILEIYFESEGLK